jgi:tRNA uridine 5-carboxymethylaminomethyl modification enzyme
MNYDIIVIGGGHAGVEAANAAAKLVDTVLLITGNIDYIGEMPCNPAIGGVAKGNIVREIDALGGLMAQVADRAGIQFRMLNKSKGMAVWGPRAQTDRYLYRQLIREHVESVDNIFILQDLVSDIIVDGTVSRGVKTENGITAFAKSVIVTTGTFLNGLAHIGDKTIVCGRSGEIASTKLSQSIQRLGIAADRLKTGTPARLDRDSIDYSKLEVQPGDTKAQPFSFTTDFELNNSAVCWTLKTEIQTHDIIRENLEKSPIYGLKSIDGNGPRYCPSIEDKVMRFGDRNGHTLFLEPEGLNRREMYLNGFSTSMPVEIQQKMINSLQGFENAHILKPAYAIEYDFFEPTQLFPTMESRVIENLYFAGQVNGTSGYEEAAGQGLVAGINAAQKINGDDKLVLGRDEAYIGVLVDDLVTKGTKEPYRMFTSRAEYRLLLRQDNADQRLMPIALDFKTLDSSVFNQRKLIWGKMELLKSNIRSLKINSDSWESLGRKPLKESSSGDRLLKRPETSLQDFIQIGGFDVSSFTIDEQVGAEADIKYEGFLKKQSATIEKMKKLEKTLIPENLDYNNVNGLLIESREKMIKIKPTTVGQASRISGVNPADISVLLVYLTQNR